MICTVQTVEPYESELTLELEPWSRHSAADWFTRLSASVSTIQRSMWDRAPRVVGEGERKVHISLDTYALDVADANKHAETLIRLHTPRAGLMEGSYTVTVASRKR